MKRTITSLAIALFVSTSAVAQSYPSTPIRIVAPYAAGGGLDAISRIIAQGMNERLGQPVIVENRPGAGGMIGADYVAQSPADGYTFLIAGAELMINPILNPSAKYKYARDFIPVMLLAESPNVIVANASVESGSLKEILERKGPADQLSFATPGSGTAQHLAFEALRFESKKTLLHIPYRGAGPAVIDLLGGQVRFSISGLPPLIPHIRSGKLRALAVTQRTRSTLVPDVPTVEEATGIKGVDMYSAYFGMHAPAGTPREIIETVQKTVAAILAQETTRKKIEEMGVEVVAMPATSFGKRLQMEAIQFEKVIRHANISLN